jgi:hypothetical protein
VMLWLSSAARLLRTCRGTWPSFSIWIAESVSG